MEKQEWFEYFEAVNGRKPTLEEFSKAKASGFLEKERIRKRGKTNASSTRDASISKTSKRKLGEEF
ncbi:MAG: hypothetical protein ACLUP5_01830 [Streptococcus sp.]